MLQVEQLLVQRRLGQIQLFRRFGDALFFCNFQDMLDESGIHKWNQLLIVDI